MTFDLSHADDVNDLVDRTRWFVRDVVLPIEDEFLGDIDNTIVEADDPSVVKALADSELLTIGDPVAEAAASEGSERAGEAVPRFLARELEVVAR